MTIAEALAQAKIALADSGSDSVALDARVLLKHVLQCTDVYLFTYPEKALNEQQQQSFQHLVSERVEGKPVAHLIGRADFWDFSVEVSVDTLIPRPETELLVETALHTLTSQQCAVCDLGTGTGAIALALAKSQPHWQVTGVDVVAGAVSLANRNKQALGLTNVEFIQSHWFDQIGDACFDLIVSNPPYVESNSPYLSQGDVKHEPLSALISGESGLDDIEFIVELAPKYLAKPGWLMVEHGYEQADHIRQLYVRRGYSHVDTLNDIQGHPRVTIGLWGCKSEQG